MADVNAKILRKLKEAQLVITDAPKKPTTKKNKRSVFRTRYVTPEEASSQGRKISMFKRRHSHRIVPIPGNIPAERLLQIVVEKGLPIQALRAIIKAGFSSDEVERLIVSHRKVENRKRLSTNESDRAVRLLRVQSLAEDAFSDKTKASIWLRRPHPELNNEPPIETSKTDIGARQVETLLAKIVYGAAA